MKRNELTHKIVGTAVLLSLTAVLTYVSNYIVIAGISINLSLITIVVASIIYGPLSGLIVGLANGVVVMFSAAAFFAINPFGTVLVCLLKSGLAGLISGFIYKALHSKNNHFAVVLSSIIVPIVNTSIFIVGSLIFFNGAFGQLISLFVTANFLVEFALTLLLSPSIYYLVKVIKNRK
ncbi:MAG: ECF transporter S component [Erysipelotrichaceae bacterium]|nr:ECF transporter S component [Erysipelotrichaceae bacterium]